MLNILLILKEPSHSFKEILGDNRVNVFNDGGNISQEVAKNSYNLILLEDRLDLVATIKESDPRAEVFLIGGSNVDAVEAIKLGATACFPKPVDLERLKRDIDGVSELARIRKETAELERQLCERYTFAGVVGKNPQMLEIFNFLRRIAPYYKTVTVTGETGVGKEEIAKALHSVSPSSKHPFIVCNCGALVENLIESELFGHKKGAFTGAVSDKAGIFEVAGEGTVFLDEIGDMPHSFQPHLLRVLQNGDFKKVGSNLTLQARCRVITATNRDLSKEVRDGRFREDLFFRLTPLTVHVPPLRSRKDDIPLLTRFILNRFYKRTGKKVLGVSMPAQTALMSYDWPGNVRELENVIEHIAILTNEAFIRLEDLPVNIQESRNKSKEGLSPKTLDEVIKNHMLSVLKQCNGNKTNAAKVLGVSRRALFRKLEKYGIE